MRWTERQQTLLQAMGLRLWLPPGDAPAAAADAQAAPPVRPPVLPPVPPPAAAPAATPVMAPPATAAVPAPLPATARQAVPAAVALPQAGPTEGLDWPALRTAVADCRACGLCETRRQTVFGTGHPQAHWMVVGEAPGEQEDPRASPSSAPPASCSTACWPRWAHGPRRRHGGRVAGAAGVSSPTR
jgi:hypothetical protein